MSMLRGGPMDGHLLKPDEATGITVVIKEQPPFSVAMAIGKVVPITPTTRVASIDGRSGTYELHEDGDYHWLGWNEA